MPPPRGARFYFAHTDRLFRFFDGWGTHKGFLSRYAGVTINASNIEGIVADVAAVLFNKTHSEFIEILSFDKLDGGDLPEVDIPRTPVDTSLAVLRSAIALFAGLPLTAELRRALAWRLAAGFQHIASGGELLPKMVIGPPEWVSLTIEDVHFGKLSKTGRATLNLTFRIYSGKYGGLTHQQRMPYAFVVGKMARDIGFPRFEKVHKNELVLCRLLGLLDTSNIEFPTLGEFHFTGSTVAYNKELRRERHKPCVKKFAWACHQCTLGHARCDLLAEFSDSHCPRATHSQKFIRKRCAKCGDEEAYFDPADTPGVCAACRYREVAGAIRLNAYRR